MEAVSFAGTLVQFTQVGLEFFSRFFALCRSANGTLDEISDREREVETLLNDLASLETTLVSPNTTTTSSPTQITAEHLEPCRIVLRQLSQVMSTTKGNGKRHVLSNIKAAACAVRFRHRFEQLDRQLSCSVQGIQLNLNIRNAQELQILHQQLEALILQLKAPLQEPLSHKPKDMGYPWESSQEYVQIDDGLDPCYRLPMDFCSSQKAFLEILSLKFRAKELPGEDLVRNAHLELWSTGDGSVKLDKDNWNLQVTPGRGLKVSFVMSTCLPFNHFACVRCGERLQENVYRRRYSLCSGCRLEFRWVEPDDISYETRDTAPMPFSGSTGPSHLSVNTSTSTTTREQDRPQPQPQPTSVNSHKSVVQEIEKVCRRLTLKWEPALNYTHRYLHCRCILRRSSPTPPSSAFPEITITTNARCPRHSNVKLTHRDYGDIDYHQDPYFDQFGGYDAFRGMVLLVFPTLYMENLGRYAFIAKGEEDYVVEALISAIDHLGDSLDHAIKEYKCDIFEDAERLGIQIPPAAMELVRQRKERDKREKEARGSLLELESLDFYMNPKFLEKFLNCPMMKEVADIKHGRWSGKPHWKVHN